MERALSILLDEIINPKNLGIKFRHDIFDKNLDKHVNKYLVKY